MSCSEPQAFAISHPQSGDATYEVKKHSGDGPVAFSEVRALSGIDLMMVRTMAATVVTDSCAHV